MKTFTLLLTFALVGVCLGAEQQPAPKPQDKEPGYQGKTLSRWAALAKDNDARIRQPAIEALGKIGLAAVPVLMQLLKDDDEMVRRRLLGPWGRSVPRPRPLFRPSRLCSTTSPCRFDGKLLGAWGK